MPDDIDQDNELVIPDTDYDRDSEIDDRLPLKYDDVYLEDGSLLEPVSVLDL